MEPEEAAAARGEDDELLPPTGVLRDAVARRVAGLQKIVSQQDAIRRHEKGRCPYLVAVDVEPAGTRDDAREAALEVDEVVADAVDFDAAVLVPRVAAVVERVDAAVDVVRDDDVAEALAGVVLFVDFTADA